MRWGIHATTVAELVLHLPGFLLSLLIVSLAGTMLSIAAGSGAWLIGVVTIWLLGGVVAVWRPVEDLIAVVVLRLRRPTLKEEKQLDAAWRAVTRAAGLERDSYRVWVEEIDYVNAIAAAGHTVAVSRLALGLPPRQLEAVLAHLLGHHVAGHTWAALLAHWYSLPGRLVLAAVRPLFDADPAEVWIDGKELAKVIAGIALAAVAMLTAIAFPPVLLLLAVPFLIAWTRRRGELHADRVAADLGYGPPLIELLYEDLAEGADEQHREASWRSRAVATHPSMATRIRALETYLLSRAR
jgi:STE24 endopeptidase